ncbi:RHOMBOID-RELATED PROTEIN [Salix koriyanagi]|uniref:RHOMBOID-RELATED PROTEIN n=1 Tax=Salix koriyanagi TaxID=2511006 RepID=A0A9Q1AH33_9ROSI|nr:RHOMBOID-RELATED PROTEIN [Salix koriyanagi]
MDRRGSLTKGMLPLLAIHAVNEYYRLPWKPPVTAALLGTNTLIYLRPAFLHHILPSIDQVWFNPHLILKYRDLRRFLLSPFYHVSDSHLVYNMMSLLWKGIQLETSVGSVEFASMLAALLAMSQGITLMLAKSLLLFVDYDKPYYYEYSAGFSGVLFAMKTVLNSQSEDFTNVYGIGPTRTLCCMGRVDSYPNVYTWRLISWSPRWNTCWDSLSQVEESLFRSRPTHSNHQDPYQCNKVASEICEEFISIPARTDFRSWKCWWEADG